jgi:hypothetical protein
MADQKISELTELTTADSDDALVIVDTSAGITKKITKSNLVTPTGRTASYVFATADALSSDKAQANQVLTGTADDVYVSAALTVFRDISTDAGGLTVNLANTTLQNVTLGSYFVGLSVPNSLSNTIFV